MNYLVVYIIVINLIASLVTVIDKINAKRHARRVPEATLLTLGIIGGAVCEYLTMKLIRHKTNHELFMTGLPIIAIVQFAIAFLIYFKVTQLS